jgi:hypothetical protein
MASPEDFDDEDVVFEGSPLHEHLQKCGLETEAESRRLPRPGRDRFYKIPFRPQSLRINFHPQILCTFPSRNNRSKFFGILWTLILDFKEF